MNERQSEEKPTLEEPFTESVERVSQNSNILKNWLFALSSGGFTLIIYNSRHFEKIGTYGKTWLGACLSLFFLSLFFCILAICLEYWRGSSTLHHVLEMMKSGITEDMERKTEEHLKEDNKKFWWISVLMLLGYIFIIIAGAIIGICTYMSY